MLNLKSACFASVSAAALLAFAPANAQTSSDNSDIETVVVTGTILHGQPPVGGEIQAVTSADISQLGANDLSQVLTSMPSDSSFNARPQVGGYGPYQTVNAPLLRYLGGGNSGSNSTLLLLNGHRMPGMGVQQTVPDIDSLPINAMQRIEAAPDGGSATYGSDAVGGVVNLITLKRYDGVQVGGQFGGADSYNQWDANITAGKEWSNGSVWIAYDYAHHDMILNKNRSYVKNLDYSLTPPGPTSVQCTPGNYTVSSVIFAPFTLTSTTLPVVNGVPTAGTPNTCDNSKYTTFFPGEDRHSVMAGVDWDITSAINFDMTAFYAHRDSFNDGGPLAYSVSTPTCLAGPAICFPVGGFAYSETADGTTAPSLGYHHIGHTLLDTWGVTPTVTAKLGSGWQMVAFYNYGEGDASYEGSALDTCTQDLSANPPIVCPYGLGTDVANGSFDPFAGVFASTAAGQAAEAYQRNFANYSEGKDRISNGRIVFDGPLFALPGGDVHAGVGGEYLGEKFSNVNTAGERSSLTKAFNSGTRNVYSAFGELSVPIVGDANRMPLAESMTFSASGRYDHYSDFGGTFNPRLALDWKPVDQLKLRGNWSRSFQAPSLASTSQVTPDSLVIIPANTFGGNAASSYPQSGNYILLLYPGGGSGLRPQTAITKELGFDFTPDIVPGLILSATWYDIHFRNRINTSAFFEPNFYQLYPTSYIMNSTSNPLTAAQIQAYLAPVPAAIQSASNVQKYLNNPSLVYALEDGREQNLSAVKTSGVDFEANYSHDTSFGTIFGGVAGNRLLTYKSQATPVGAFTGIALNDVVIWRVATTVGASFGDVLAKVVWNHTGGNPWQPTANNGYQSWVDGFDTVNLALQYTPTDWNAMNDMTFTLNADNLFDAKPSVIRGTSNNGYQSQDFTLGRYIQIGITKKF